MTPTVREMTSKRAFAFLIFKEFAVYIVAGAFLYVLLSRQWEAHTGRIDDLEDRIEALESRGSV